MKFNKVVLLLIRESSKCQTEPKLYALVEGPPIKAIRDSWSKLTSFPPRSGPFSANAVPIPTKSILLSTAIDLSTF